MNLHFSYKSETAKTPEVEREINQQVQKLQRRLAVFKPDLIHLHGTISDGSPRGYAASLNLRLPTGQLNSNDTADTLQSVLKATFSDLVFQVSKHKELLRSQNGRHTLRGKAIHGTAASLERNLTEYSPQGYVPDPAQFAGNTKTQTGVRMYIDANLDRLLRFISGEIQMREANDDMREDTVTATEVIDEVVVAALSEEEKPPHMSVERWLYRLAVQAIRRVSDGNNGTDGDIKLEQPAGKQNVTGSDEDVLQFHQYEDRGNTRGDELADGNARNPESGAMNDEFVAQLYLALQGVEADARQAFILFAIEGFTLEEIAQITDRDPKACKALIDKARDFVADRLPSSNGLKKTILRHSKTA
jgi:RNA polymerase sigma factor (sigma-70 family)